MIEINKIYNMDCLEGMKMLSDKSIDMIITDTPYGINLTPQRSGSKFKNTKVVNDNNLTVEEYAKRVAKYFIELHETII